MYIIILLALTILPDIFIMKFLWEAAKDDNDGYMTKYIFITKYILHMIFSSGIFIFIFILIPIVNIIFIIIIYKDHEYKNIMERNKEYVVNFKNLSRSEQYRLLSKALIDYNYFKNEKELYKFMDGVMVVNKLTNNIGNEYE